MSEISRRAFVKRSAFAGIVAHLATINYGSDAGELPTSSVDASLLPDIQLSWLDGAPKAGAAGITWGMPWSRGACKAPQGFSIKTAGQDAVPIQTWPLAFWPDGSLKWTAHAIALNEKTAGAEKFFLAPAETIQPARKVSVSESDDQIEIDTLKIRCKVPRHGTFLIASIQRDGKTFLQDGQLIARSRSSPAPEVARAEQEEFASEVENVVVEQTGPVRAVVRIEGKHASPNRAWLPFVVRLYFYVDSDQVRMIHTFIFDGDEQKDFISALGVKFSVPMRDELHDRHVRFVGADGGVWAEAIRGLTGLRRDPGEEIRKAQLDGKATPPVSQFAQGVRDRINLIPAWGDYSLSQPSCDGFEINKRTKIDHGWIRVDGGTRAAGVGYVGGASGGVAFGLRDFWKRFPSQIDVRNANTDASQVTLWLYSPQAPAMDLRFYHDEMGMETYAQQLQGLEITYEDYEKDFGTAHGIARTNEITLSALPATPSREAIVEFAQAIDRPPLLCCSPKYYCETKIFGALFNEPDRSSAAKIPIEGELNFLIDYYLKQIEQRRWYGFWNHGDVMHTYDPDRHVWRYDIGGYAWDNSELSTDLWLWYAFLRSGRADLFRMAEAMTRHTGEVDVYHLGKFKDLGSRHNVQHWGCSAKQLRISTPIYRRFYYFLTADERVGDLMRELNDADQTFVTLDPIRKIRKDKYEPDPHALSVGTGTDWGALAAIWLTEWERSGDTKYRDKLINGMKSIGALPYGFFTSGPLFDPASGSFFLKENTGASVSHLGAIFGLVEVCAELIMLADVPEFEKAWLQYCELYNAPRAQRTAALGGAKNVDFANGALAGVYSRLTAYAAWKKKDPALAQRAWKEFLGDDRRGGNEGIAARSARTTRRLQGPTVLNPIDEATGVSTNDAAQWSLAAMQNLALIGDAMPG